MTERKPRVDPLIPTIELNWYLGRVHVATPDHELVATLSERIATLAAKDPRWTAKIKRQTIRYALWRHHRNFDLYAAVMNGSRPRKYVPAAYRVK